MPRKSITLNGFIGGINYLSEPSDIRNTGDGKDELWECYNFLCDTPGAVTATIPFVATASGQGLTIKSDAVSDDGEELTHPFNMLIQDSTLYNYMGVFSVGNKINWSKNEDYQVDPYAGGNLDGSDDDGTFSEEIDGVDVKIGNERDGDWICFAGVDAPHNKIDLRGSKACFFNHNDTSQNKWWNEGYSGSKIAPGETIRQIQDLDGGGGGLGYAGFNLNGTSPDTRFFMCGDTVDEGSEIINWGDTVDDATPSLTASKAVWTCWRNSSTLTNSLVHATSGNSPLDDVDWFGLHKNYTSSPDKDTSVLVFRGGEMYLDSHGDTQDGGFASMSSTTNYGKGFNISGHQIAVDLHVNQPTGIEKIVIVAANMTDQIPTILWDYTPTSYHFKTWEITPSRWAAAGCENGFGRIVFDYDQAFATHTNFDGTAVSILGIAPMFSANTNGPTNPNVKGNHIIAIRELSTVKPVEGNWRSSKYRIFHSKIKNGVESLLYEYSGYTSPGSQTATLKIHKPSGSIDQGTDAKGKLYYQELNQLEETVSDQFYLGEWDFSRGWKSVTESSFTEWDANSQAKTTYQGPPMTSTYNLESGYPDEVEYINARWKHAAVSNRTAYIGNVQQPIDTAVHSNSWDNGLILKTVPGSIGGFPDNQFIDLELGEDYITNMESIGDRLIVFTSKRCVVVNVAQDIEFLEDTFDQIGVATARQVTHMEGGLAICNGSGVYYLDVNNQRNPVTCLTEGKISPFRTWDPNSSMIAYEPMKKILWCWRYDTGQTYWSWITKSWVGMSYGSDYITNPPTTQSISFKRPSGATSGDTPNIMTVYANQANYYYLNYYGCQIKDGTKGVITSNVFQRDIHNLYFITGAISCGDIGRNKKFIKLYYNVHNPREGEAGETINLRVGYSLDKGDTFTYPTQGGFSDHGTLLNNGENVLTIGETGKHIMFNFRHPHGSDNDISSSLRLSDLTLVYREKSVK